MKLALAIGGGVILLLVAAFVYVCYVLYQAVKTSEESEQ